jgi:hypothetical protein
MASGEIPKNYSITPICYNLLNPNYERVITNLVAAGFSLRKSSKNK